MKKEEARKRERIVPVDQSAALSANETTTLAECETIVTNGIRSFVDVGNALRTIRDQRLYRGTHETFDKYVKENWDLGRAHAYRLIEAAVTVETLYPIGDVLPANESHVRPLLQFPSEDRPTVWKEVVEQLSNRSEDITAKTIEGALLKKMVLSKDDGPFKKRRLQIKRQKRECRQKNRGKREHNQDKAAVWNLQEHLDRCALDVRYLLETWPTEHRAALALLLRGLADEVETIPTITCPNCGRHAADDDGDCCYCHEPSIVATEGSTDAQ